jgi:hypothetical protein
MRCIYTLICAPGMPGLVTGLAILIVVYCITVTTIRPKVGGYPFDPPRKEGESVVRTFEPILARYNRLSEIVIGLGTGSIALLAGSSAFHSAGKLPASYSSPLVLLALNVAYLVLFTVLLNHWYEMWQHGNPYTHPKYRAVVSLGFSGLLCFAFGYLWLGFALVRD